jgi:hypothetical protein
LNAESLAFVSATEGGVEHLADPGFEAGTPNPFWTESSTNFGTPLCTIATCGTGLGTGPNSGLWWAWFGGISFLDEEASVSQAVTFPSSAATLSFHIEAPVCQGSPADYIEVLVDGNQEWVLFGDDPLCGFIGYTQQFVDLSAYGDGGVHTVEFHGETFVGATTSFFIDDVSLESGEPPLLARFLVTKNFDDDNPSEVEVTLSCNTGLPLEQTTTISEGDPVNFVVGDFEQGSLNCEVSEVVPLGYEAEYNNGTGCVWEGLSGGQNICQITNSLDAVEIEVTKVWIDENPQFNAQDIADATWECSDVAFGDDSGLLEFFGNPAVDSFFVFPSWDGGTDCEITEISVSDSGVEIDDSECDSVVVFPGSGGSCTIYNTRLYEGIPTLNQYGLAVLALLMLGVGLIGFRRLV